VSILDWVTRDGVCIISVLLCINTDRFETHQFNGIDHDKLGKRREPEVTHDSQIRPIHVTTQMALE
jgi:hypothetical protein